MDIRQRLLGMLQTQPDQLQTLLGAGYDPRTARMQWLGGTLQGLGAGLASGDPGAWAQGAIAGGGQGVDDYRKRALLGYQMQQQADNQAYDRSRDAKSDERWQTQFDYGVGRDKVEDNRWQTQFDYNRGRDGVEDTRWRLGYELEKQNAAQSTDPWRIASPEEKQAIGLPVDAPVIITKNGPKVVSDGGTSVNVNTGGGTEKQIFDETKAVTDAARSAATGLAALDAAGQSLPGAITGAAANERLALQKVATLFGADPSAVQDTETFRSAIAPQVAAMLKATVGSAQISNADREFAEKAAGGAITLDKGSIERLLNIMRAANSEIVRRQNRTLDTVYPEGQGFDRERSLFGVPNVPKAYPSPIGPQSPGASPSAAKSRVRRYNPQTGRIE